MSVYTRPLVLDPYACTRIILMIIRMEKTKRNDARIEKGKRERESTTGGREGGKERGREEDHKVGKLCCG